MKDLHTSPDEHLEARITAWVLDEASPFEAAELEALCTADPNLQLFLNRTKAIHSLLLETPPSDSDHFWKLSPPKREKLDPIIGPNNSSRANKNTIRPHAAYRTIIGIAAVLAVTIFIIQLFFSPSKNLPLTMASGSSELNSEMPATRRMNIVTHNEDLADSKDSGTSTQSAISASLGISGLEKVGDNIQPPAPASNAQALGDELALNEHQLDKASFYRTEILKDQEKADESFHQTDEENTFRNETLSATVPSVPSIAGALSATAPLKLSPPTDGAAYSTADASYALAQTKKEKTIIEVNRDRQTDDTFAAKSAESSGMLSKGKTIEGATSNQSLQTAPKQDGIVEYTKPEKRELLSSHTTLAKFIGIKDHLCMGRTSHCPDRCGHSGKLATFEIIEYLDYQKPGEYGDPKQTTFQLLIRDNQGITKIPNEFLSIIESLKPDTKVKLSWNHDYVTKDKASSPERPITKIEAEQ